MKYLNVIILFMAVACQMVPNPNPNPEGKFYYVGKIGKHRIQFQLKIDENGHMYGHYYYENSGQDIHLKGVVSKTNEFILLAFKSNFENRQMRPSYATGDFFQGTYSRHLDTITGRWSQPKQSELQFEVSQVAIYKSDNTGSTHVSVEFPSFPNTPWLTDSIQIKANRLKEIQSKYEGFVRNTIEVMFYGNNVVSFLNTANNNDHHFHRTSFHFDLKRKQEFSLEDLFESPRVALKTLADYCIWDLDRQGATFLGSWADHREKDAEFLHTFYVRPNGLTFVMDELEVSARTDGEFYITVPFSYIEHLIKFKGPLEDLVSR